MSPLYTLLYLFSFSSLVILPRVIISYLASYEPITFCSNNILMMFIIHASNIDMITRVLVITKLQNYIYKVVLLLYTIIPLIADMLSIASFSAECKYRYFSIDWMYIMLVTTIVHGIQAFYMLLCYHYGK